MGIKPETDRKVKNMEELSKEEKQEVLEATQRAGFNPIIYQVRVMFDLIDVIKDFNKKSSCYTKIMIGLTVVIAILTLVLILK